MNCNRCNAAIEAGEERDFHGQLLCEDCYMDALSPAGSCDPWAVYSAKTLSQHAGEGLEVNETQAKILKILEETGGVELKTISERLGIGGSALEREIAALRHMERVRGQMRDGKKICVLW